MSYKIVQTWEHNKHRLSAVPSTWEENNILKYPRKNITKYLKIGTSIPELDWKQIKCDVKRRELPNYETADYVLQEMINHTDTEDDTTNTLTCKQSKPELNLNIIADEIVNLQPKIQQNVRNPNAFQESSVTYHHDVILEKQNKNATTVGPAAGNLNSGLSYEYFLPMCGSETNMNAENFEAIISVQNILLSNQTKILEQLNSLQNVQTTTNQKIASLSVQLEDTLMQINNFFQNRDLQVTPLSACKSVISNTAFTTKPIETVQQLDELELELSNSANRLQKKQLYSLIFSGGKGIDCAYTLADVLFSREFLCQCSWSGGSRGHNEAKVAWKSYKNILSFFWEMVNSWDNKYTVSHNVEFFKGILKNAKKRNMAKKERASTSRKRTKSSKSQSVNHETESDNEGTSVKTAKKIKIEKEQTKKVEEGSEKKDSAKILNSMIEENECSIKEKDQETTNDNVIPGDVDSNINEIENTEEEEEDHEREEDTSNDKESTEDSDETFKDNDIAQNKIEEEKIDDKENIYYSNSTIEQNKIVDNGREKRIEENEEDTLKENNEKKTSDEKNTNVSNSVNVKIVQQNDRLEENMNSKIGDNENDKKDNDKEKENVHGTIKLDSNFIDKENVNIMEKQKKEKKRDRGTPSKSKNFMENKKKKETIKTKKEK